MTAHDVQLADILKSANILHKEPVHITEPATGLYRGMFKRVLDTALIVVTLPLVLPLILTLAMIVALDGSNPFYSQKRIGKNGRIFRMWKLRSMVSDADDVLETYLAADPRMRAEWDSKQKLMNDPRVTTVGRFLRKTSIDELPQLFNVLRGEMSLVGPRPMMVEQQKLYPGRDYYDLLPGVTGFWQISDRNNTSFADRAFYDARYNTKLSFKTDVQTLAATVQVVLRGTGC